MIDESRPHIARSSVSGSEVHYGPFSSHAKAIEWANKQKFPVIVIQLQDPWVDLGGGSATSSL